MLRFMESTGTAPVLAFLVAILLLYIFRKHPKPRLGFEAPLIDGGFQYGQGINHATANAEAVLKKFYPEFRDHFFRVMEPHGETLVVPAPYIDELKSLPSDILSFHQAFDERQLGKYTFMRANHFGNSSGTIQQSINENLTRNLKNLTPIMVRECEYAFDANLGSCDEWTEVKFFEKLITIIALVSGRIFVGEDLNRNEEYKEMIIKYTMEVFIGVATLQYFRPWLRSLLPQLGVLPPINQLHRTQKKMRKLLEPLVKQRINAMAAGEKLPDDMISWNLTNSSEKAKHSVAAQAHNQLLASVAAIHTTGLTMFHIICDLICRPDCMAMLRKELDEVTASTPLSKTNIPKLKLLDSFCKESQRLNPLRQMGFVRKALQPVVLHDGKVLPPGTHIAFAAAQRAGDERVFIDPAEFQPWRFAKLREGTGQENKHLFVSTDPDEMLFFGCGNHICPGRFFAETEMKIVLAHLLRHYDMKFLHGEGRPGNIQTPDGLIPDVTKNFLIRKRSNL